MGARIKNLHRLGKWDVYFTRESDLRAWGALVERTWLGLGLVVRFGRIYFVVKKH